MQSYIVQDPEWTVNITTKCPKKHIADAFGNRSLVDIGYVFLGFGSYLGILIHSHYLPGLMMRVTSSEKHWYKWPLARLAVGGVISGPPWLLTVLLNSSHISNVYLLGFWKTAFPSLYSGIFLFGFHDLICVKLKILTFVKDDESKRDGDCTGSAKVNPSK